MKKKNKSIKFLKGERIFIFLIIILSIKKGHQNETKNT